MYRAVELAIPDKVLHRFVWRSHLEEPLKDYRMTRVTFGVCASSFAANMAVKQNAMDHSLKYPTASQVVYTSFYVDDCLTGAADPDSTLLLQQQLTELFALGGFVLRKWNSNDPSVLEKIPEDLSDSQVVQAFPETNEYSKALGVEWNVSTDQFRLTVSNPPQGQLLTKRGIVSDVAKVFDALGLFSPATINLLQCLWELKLDWDDPIPKDVLEIWARLRKELPVLATVQIPRCYSPVGLSAPSVELHGFSDASEDAYADVVYLRITDSTNKVYSFAK